jgi:hypothetical protein
VAVLYGHRVRFALALLLCATVAGLTGASARPVASACQTAEVRVHDEAVFGHFASPAAAAATMKRARRLGFKGLKLENEGCGDYELEIDGADDTRGRGSFAAEAKRAGFQVTFEQIGAPLAFKQGEVYGLFGRFPAIAAANALSQKLATISFRYVDIVFSGGRWLVVMPQVPVTHALSIAGEVHKAGFRIAFHEGTH